MTEQNDKTNTPSSNTDIPETRSSLWWYAGIVAFVILIVGLLTLPIYFIPRATGDNFLDALLRLDRDALRGEICDDAATVTELGRSLLDQGGSAMRSFVIAFSELEREIPLTGFALAASLGDLNTESAYTILGSKYTFRLIVDPDTPEGRLRRIAGLSSPEITIGVRRNVMGFTACIEAG